VSSDRRAQYTVQRHRITEAVEQTGRFRSLRLESSCLGASRQPSNCPFA
jgi:hypothetical protein